MKGFLFLIILILALIAAFSFKKSERLHTPLNEKNGDSQSLHADCQGLVAYNYPKFAVPQRDTYFICRTGYALEYNPRSRTPMWVAEKLTPDKITGIEERTNDFAEDPDLPSEVRSTNEDYFHSGYDRGHMAPAGDFRSSIKEMEQSFYLSNMVPQVGEFNNRGIWETLEKYVRYWDKERGELYIITGPIYYQQKAAGFIGKDHVAIPTHLFKIIYDKNKNDAIAFVIPNAPIHSDDLHPFITNVVSIQYLTGIVFFPDIPLDKKKEAVYTQDQLWR